MKAKIFFTTIFLLSFLENTFSQEYHPLLNNSSWIVNDFVSCCRPPEYLPINEGTDVVIGGFTYKRFNDPFPDYDSNWGEILTVDLREDVTERKVYKIVEGAEMVLYDFSLEMDDTIFQYGYTFAVTAIEDIPVNGGMRKKMTLHSIELYFGYSLVQVWIEGVGSVAHPFYPGRNMLNVTSSSGGLIISTTCSFQNGLHIYGNANCPAMQLNTIDQELLTNQIVISPNPFATELTISSDIDFQNATFKLYNSQGRLVREINHLHGQKITINRENLSSGLYFAQLLENNQLIKTSKMMVD
jgi:hypothetical protein